MDIEHLSKSQIILLTLLISFVTSIATGIVTVSLMDQAPPVVAQTVNRVIERTIETATAASPSKAQTASVVTKTVVVNESERISAAVAKIEPSLVRIYSESSEQGVFLGMGIVIEGGGKVIADTESLGSRSDISLARADDSRVRGFVVARDNDNGLAYIQGATSTEDKALTWTPASISVDQAVIGQSVVAVAGKSTTRIAPGLVTSIVPVGGGHIIDSNIDAPSIIGGSPLISTDGLLIGVSTSASRASSPQGFIPSTVLLSPMAN